MRTHSSSNLVGESSHNLTSSNPKRSNHRRSKQPFILEESPVDTMVDQRTMVELFCAPTEGYAEAIVVPPILAEHFELKHSLINMMNPDQFFGLEKDNPHDHIQIAKLTHAVNQQTSAVTTAMIAILKQFQATPPPAFVKAVEEICVTCVGAHPYYQCLATDGKTFPEFQDNIQGYVSASAVNYNQGYNQGNNFNQDTSYQAPIKQNQAVPLSQLEKIKKMNEINIKAMQTQINNVKNELRNEMKTSIQASISNQTNELKNMMASFFQMNTIFTSSLGPLPSNTIANLKGELKAITTRSGIILDGPSIPMPPPFINLEKDERIEETLMDPERAEYTIKVPPPLSVMSSASSAVIYTSVYIESEPRRVFLGADEELSDEGSLRVIMYGYDGLPMLPTPSAPHDEDEHEPMFIQPHDPDFMPEPIYPEYIPLEDEHILPTNEQVLPPVVSATVESPEYVVESDPKEDPEEYEDDETKDEVERLLAMPTPSPSPLASLSPPSTGERLARCTAPVALPSPPLPPPLHMPPPIDRRDDIPETKMPPHKRLCLSTLGFRYEVGESSTTRPTGDRGIDYGFVNTLDAEARRRGIGEVGYGIRDTWVDPAEAVPEIAPMTVGEVNNRVTELAELHEHDTQDLYALLEDARDSRTRIYQRFAVDSQRVDLLIEDRIAHQETIQIVEDEAYAAREAWAHSIGLSQTMQQTEIAELRETDRRCQAQMAETLRVMGDMRRGMSDMQAELLALREQPRRAGQPGGDARFPNHQDAPRDADSHI
nr:hypothetical protein [Tanacetum cinerariifolium]